MIFIIDGRTEVLSLTTADLLCPGAESFRMPRQAKEEEAGTMAKIVDTLKGYYDDTLNTASSYMDSIRGLKLEEKAK